MVLVLPWAKAAQGENWQQTAEKQGQQIDNVYYVKSHSPSEAGPFGPSFPDAPAPFLPSLAPSGINQPGTAPGFFMARKRPPPHPALDLFGEVPVYTHDIDAWLIAVPRIRPGSRYAAYYVHAYSVVDKIKAAKLRGTFEAQTTLPPPAEDGWANRFSWTP